MRKHVSLLIILITALVGGLIGVGTYKFFEPKEQIDFEEKQKVYFANLTDQPTDQVQNGLDFTYASAKATPAVVHIKTLFNVQQQSDYYFDPFRDFFGLPDNRQNPYQPQQKASMGSGVIISEDGYIVTNNHVVENSSEIEVVLNDKRTYKAVVVGTDPTTDLTLLKIDEKNLEFLTFGNSDALKVGEWVLAVGNPFNLTSTVTAGIVSAKARNINLLDDQYRIESFIQTDAVVNPGNSGGALVNTKGELVGINTAIQSQTGSYIGYSFAIPVNIVKKVMDDLLKFGEVQRGFIGINIRDINAAFAQEINLNEIKGVYVTGLTENGAGQEAGLETGDIITKIQDVNVNSASELQEQVGRFRPGDKIAVSFLRKGKEKSTSVTLKNIEGNTNIVRKEEKKTVTVLGAELEELSKNEKSRLRVQSGVRVKRINTGKLQQAGLQNGFVITHINKKPVSSPNDISEIIQDNKGRIVGIEGFYPDDGTKYYYGFGL